MEVPCMWLFVFTLLPLEFSLIFCYFNYDMTDMGLLWSSCFGPWASCFLISASSLGLHFQPYFFKYISYFFSILLLETQYVCLMCLLSSSFSNLASMIFVSSLRLDCYYFPKGKYSAPFIISCRKSFIREYLFHLMMSPKSLKIST